MKKYNAMYFIKKFEAIPHDKWCTQYYEEGDKKCALGHCGANFYKENPTKKEMNSLKDLFFEHFSFPVTIVNDSLTELGDHPKERILNALYLINAMDSYVE